MQTQQEPEKVDLEYSQGYKVWKKWSDSLRGATRDFYVSTDPVLDEVWLPVLNDYLNAFREMAALSQYRMLAGYGESLAGLAKSYHDLECVPPKPPEPPQDAKDPKLKNKGPDCPLNPPIKIGLLVIKIELGCDKVKLEGGEVLKFKIERDMVKGQTRVWVGAGVDIAKISIDVGNGGLGGTPDADKPGKYSGSWTPPVTSTGFGLTGEGGFYITVGDDGSIPDVGMTSKASASANVGGASVNASVSSGMGLEGGPTFDASVTGSAGNASIPGLSIGIPQGQ